MCGIGGLWQPGGAREDDLHAAARRMACALEHRGPDGAGDWVDGAAGLALAFRRLAVLDLSVTGNQPMVSADGRYAIVFNGEFYNFQELRGELGDAARALRGTSDTEVALETIARHGVEAALPRLWGMFALAVWDCRARELWLARDRLGKKPLYYARAGGTWLFGSELRALRTHPACPAAVDRRALTALLRYGYVPAPATIYSGVQKVPPGTVLRITADATAPQERTFWRARDVVQTGISHRLTSTADEAIDALESLLRDAVGRRLIADVPLGAFLSGGIDSSTVVALMQALSPRPVRTFTIRHAQPEFDESAQAAAVARHLGTDHTTLELTAHEMLDVVPQLATVYDEPFADSSQIPTCLVSRLARREVTVSLTGDGGDEVFGGYTRHLWAERVWRRAHPAPALARRAASAALVHVPPAAWDAVYRAAEGLLPARARQRRPGHKLRKLARVIGARDVHAVYPLLVSQWDAPEAVVIGGGEHDSWAQGQSSDLELPTLTEQMMLQDLVGYLPDDILTKVDRASMSVGLEVRAPLLDHRVVEWAWRLPLSLRVRDGVGKWILRQVLHRHVPASLVDRPKAGFALPLGDWLRGALREWAEALVGPERLAAEGLFRPAPVQALWRAHLAGASEEDRLWPVLMFQAWHERAR